MIFSYVFKTNNFTSCFHFSMIVCDAGYYGISCQYNCSGNCLDGEECNRESGNCSKGCEPGFMGTDCVASNLENFLIIIHYFIHSYANNIH